MPQSNSEITAKHRFLRMSPRKVGLVVSMIRGRRADEALRVLEFCPKAAAKPVIKTLRSALANAESKNKPLNFGNWIITDAIADKAPTLHRWLAGSRGRAWKIKKRRTHLVIGITKGQRSEIKSARGGIAK